MNFPIDSYPTAGATNENVLFASLGAFWTTVFNDRSALKGLTIAQAEAGFQAYYDLIDAINSYSASSVPIFKKAKWLPIMIKKSSLNTSMLIFGNEVKFGDTVSTQPYVFGAAAPQEDNVYVMPLPENLRELSILANRVIAPDFVLVNNMDIKIKDSYLYLYKDPFNLPNISTFDLVDEMGNQVYFSNPLTGQQIPDQVLVLWGYNAKINEEALRYNIAYLFGVNLPSCQMSKDILSATVNLFSSGPSIKQLLAICSAFIGVKPVASNGEVVVDMFVTSTNSVIVTDKNVYRYDLYYIVKPEIGIGTVLSVGDIMVDALEFYDDVIFKDWWLTKMSPKISIQSGNVQSPSLTIPPYMFVGTYKYGITFKNSLELVTRTSDGTITFPVTGDPVDVQAFQSYINQSQDEVALAIGQIMGDPVNGLQNNKAQLINPLDFLFKTVFANNTAMMKINFKTEAQLQLFTQYFSIIKNCLPKHVYFIFFFDITIPEDSYTTANTVVDSAVQVYYPVQGPTSAIIMNRLDSGSSNQNASCVEKILVRPIPNNVSTKDYNLLDLTK